MSVYASQRSESKAEFIRVAQELATYTLEQVKKFPKAWKRDLVDRLLNSALNIHEYVTKANSYYIHQYMLEVDFIERERLLGKARAEIFSMSSLLTIVFAFVLKGNNFLGDKKKTSNMFKEWARLLNYEAALLKGIIESDKKRYKRYQQKSAKSKAQKEPEQKEESEVILPEETFNLDETTE